MIWRGSYIDSDVQMSTTYQVDFDWPHRTFSGSGTNATGEFVIEGGVFSPDTGCLAWGERTLNSDLYAKCSIRAKNSSAAEIPPGTCTDCMQQTNHAPASI